jgi:hypothetical protein
MTGQSIRRSARDTPLIQARFRFRAFPSGRAPALHASRLSHNPCLVMLPLRFAHARRMRPLSVGRVAAPFVQQDHHAAILKECKSITVTLLDMVNRRRRRPRLCRVGCRSTNVLGGLVPATHALRRIECPEATKRREKPRGSQPLRLAALIPDSSSRRRRVGGRDEPGHDHMEAPKLPILERQLEQC